MKGTGIEGRATDELLKECRHQSQGCSRTAASQLSLVPPVDCMSGQGGLQITRVRPGHVDAQGQPTIWLFLQLELFKYLFNKYY